jgi:hypothetical protein
MAKAQFKVLEFGRADTSETFEAKLNAAADEGFEWLASFPGAGAGGHIYAVMRKDRRGTVRHVV